MDIKNHQKTAHAPSTIAKIQAVAIGNKLSNITQTFGSTYRRLDPDKPSPTVTRSGYRDFIDRILIPSGTDYIDEIIYRYLLTSGDALGGKMRNIVGSIANEKLNRFVISQHNYLSIGELKGGIDPAGADEHWKTANTALSRVRKVFDQLPLMFIGAAIESAMSVEIFAQYQSGDLANCANLTSDEQLASLCEWLVGI